MLYVLSIYDSAAKYYRDPMIVKNIGEALREFGDACNNKETFLFKHPGDFTLFHLGEFDEETGSFNLLVSPSSLGKAIEFVRSDLES